MFVIIVVSIVVIVCHLFTSVNAYVSMTARQHLNLYMGLLPFIFVEAWCLLQYKKNDKLAQFYRHRSVVIKSIGVVGATHFNTDEYNKQYLEFALKQYELMYKPNEKYNEKKSVKLSKEGVSIYHEG